MEISGAAMQCNATLGLQCNAMQHLVSCNAMQLWGCNAMQCNAMQCNSGAAMQCNATSVLVRLKYGIGLEGTWRLLRLHRNAMQCDATSGVSMGPLDLSIQFFTTAAKKSLE